MYLHVSVLLAYCFVVAVNAEPACPAPMKCTRTPVECRATAFMVYNNRVCHMCDACITDTTWSMPGGDGCPTRPCPFVGYSDGCGARTYFVWKGKVCQNCDTVIC